jgi:excisionase family DNA binding protein
MTKPARRVTPIRPRTTVQDHDHVMLTIAEVCAELRIPRSTFYDWRAKGLAPRCITLPSRKVRVERSELDAWKQAHRDAA